MRPTALSHHLPELYPPPPTVARAGTGIMLTAILTASAILINRFFICKSPLIKICSADLPRQESRTHPLLFCPRWTNHQHHCNKFWSIWQCFKANCRISGKMAFQPAFRPEEGGDSVKPLANDKPTQKQQQRPALSGRPLCVNLLSSILLAAAV